MVVLLAEHVGDEVREHERQRAPQAGEAGVHDEQNVEPLLAVVGRLAEDLARAVHDVHRRARGPGAARRS